MASFRQIDREHTSLPPKSASLRKISADPLASFRHKLPGRQSASFRNKPRPHPSTLALIIKDLLASFRQIDREHIGPLPKSASFLKIISTSQLASFRNKPRPHSSTPALITKD